MWASSKWGIDPERDIWSLGVMVQGSGQMGELSARRRRRRRRRRRHLEIGVWNSFSFRAWIGLIWEISPRKPDHSAWNFGARFFCKNPKNQENHISNISRISGNSRKHVPKIIQGSTTQPLEPPARLRPPADRISRLWRMLQTSMSNISRIWENKENPFPSISRIWEIRKIRFPVFPGYEKIVKFKFPNISKIRNN